MKGQILLKRLLKHMAGCLAAASSLMAPPRSSAGIVVLMYHRVADTGRFDPSIDDWNVSPRRFERQIAWLSQHAECLSLAQLRASLEQPATDKPRVVVTFDDGFGNFATDALPVLERHAVPAGAFLVTHHVGMDAPYPFDRWAQRNQGRVPRSSWAPITWEQVDRCAQSGLVTFGSHSHTHPEPRMLVPAQLAEEAIQSRGVLRTRMGEAHAFAYAYPYGSTRLGHVNTAYTDAVRNAGFSLGFTTDLGRARPWTDPFTLPRVEVHGWDGSAVLAARARGVLWPFQLTDSLRRARRTGATAAAG